MHINNDFEIERTGYLDGSGQLWLAGRLKDTIRTGSETVHASDVERCLASHPAVAAAAVIGLPDVRFGQQVLQSLSMYAHILAS